jgi:HAD superfamily hydrolase (TIGR01509 family)
MTSAIKLVAFDLGNVMVDVQEAPVARELAKLCGKTEAEVFDAVFSPAKKAFFESGKMSWEQHAANAIAALGLPIGEPELRRIYKTVLVPDERVIGIVAKAAERVDLTIASNTSQPHWEWVQDNLPFAPKFKVPLLSHLVGAMKPDAAFFQPLFDQTGLAPGEVAFFDDRPDNIAGAQAIGIRAFQFTSAERLLRDLGDCGVRI